MIQKRTLIGILLIVVLVGAIPILGVAAPSSSHPAQEGTELLKNPGFEGLSCAPGSEPPECLDNWSNSANFDGSFHDNIFTPQGWITWWRKGGNYGQPEVKTIPNVAPFTGELPRIRSGYYATLLFTFYRLQDTGLYQVVTGLEPNSTVQLSAYAHGWSCDNNDKMGYSCGDPWNQTFQVGIDPNGGTDPFSPGIIWSGEQRSPDHYNLIGPVSAQVGAGGSVTVFLRSKTKWAYQYQDAYWDDASLVMTSPGTPPTDTPLPPPPPPTAGPSPTPRATPTPRPDGAIVHIVESGDTLFGIALMYGVKTDQLRQLNAGSLGPNDMINVGQALVISIPAEAPTPSPLPAPPTPEPATLAPGDPGETAGGASSCVLAYHDRNGDTFRDEATEELLPNAEFVIATAAGVMDRYTSNGVNEPHCFTGLPVGAYRVIQTAPAGYTSSGPAEYNVGLPEGESFEFQFGDVRSENPESPGEVVEPTQEGEEPTEPAGETTASRIFGTVAKISGILVLLLAGGIAVLFFLNRRRM